ncbi:PREDICTED: erythroblast NAD(P)(+)--arginine ADP-ribosyltransferase-like, partial [Gekko japonicus]|uniref:NAD(P)(+)--arginine ADP-ribosyltransferase n=1 Tax=Gekko japonicus TaxID=146911 RepID=A0ABM1KEK8_GEKJA
DQRTKMLPPCMVLVLYLMGFFSGELQGFSVVSTRMQDSTLDMATSSFDDQYNGCVDEMEDKVGELQRTEFANKTYANIWDRATAEWNEQKPAGLKREYGIAVVAYTESKGSLFRDLNDALRKAGKSKDYYLKDFKLKSFHYLLTRALQVLWTNSNGECYTTYRGVNGIRFITERSKEVRFGCFASSSLNKYIATGFGDDTFFTIKTCHGTYIKEFSIYPGEEEVLIPPYELFRVEDFVKTPSGKIRISLTSVGKFSKYNCVYAKGKNQSVF